MEKKESNLNFAVIPHEFLTKIEIEIEEMKKMLKQKSVEEKNAEWIESTKIPEILGISRKTWQTYRDKRLISFSQVGSKIYVKRADLEGFLQEHNIPSRNY